jgi:hypothetical protein
VFDSTLIQRHRKFASNLNLSAIYLRVQAREEMRKMSMISMILRAATNDSPCNALFTIQGPVHHSREIAVIELQFGAQNAPRDICLSFRLSRA